MQVTTPKGTIDIPNVEPRRPLPEEALALAMETLRDLPPGFRFPIDKGERQKAWFDGSLLDV